MFRAVSEQSVCSEQHQWGKPSAHVANRSESEPPVGSCSAAGMTLLQQVRSSCLWRLRTWPPPPRYSTADWAEEAQAISLAAGWEAMSRLGPGEAGKGLAAHLYGQIMARLLTAYRREWQFGLRHACWDWEETAEEEPQEGDGLALSAPTPDAAIREAQSALEVLELLAPGQRSLLQQLFFEGKSEQELATALCISQRAVSKRKQAALQRLRTLLKKENFWF